jgi:hypothetical protein
MEVLRIRREVKLTGNGRCPPKLPGRVSTAASAIVESGQSYAYDGLSGRVRCQIQSFASELSSGLSAVGPGKIALLEQIMKIGSLSGAADKLGMSYRRAWLLLESLNTTHGFSRHGYSP